jgi:glycosyltransferase 2 family protein
VKWLLPLLLVGGLLVAALHWGDLRNFAKLLASMQPLWLLAALGLQILTYVSLSAEWALVLGAGGKRAPVGRLFSLTITKLFADQVVPTAGLSGNMVVIHQLTRLAGKRALAVAAVILEIVAYYVSYALAALAALIMIWLHGDISGFIVVIVSVFLCLAVAIPAGTLWLHRKGPSAAPKWLSRFDTAKATFEMIGSAPRRLVRSPALIAKLSALNGAVFVLDALTLLFCLFGLGVHVTFTAAYVPLILASIVVTLGPIPMGLGSFEATCVGMLRVLGVPFEAALSATLLYRGFALWLPLVLGMALARRELKVAI